MSEPINFPEQKKKDRTKIGAVIILIISALVFLPFGASAVFESFLARKTVNTYGSYAGKKITYEPGTLFFNTASSIANAYKNYGINVDDQTYYRIMHEAYRQTILNMAYTDAVKASGYSVPKDAVNRYILPAFSDENGNFSQRMYNQISQSDLTSMRAEAESTLFYSRFVKDLFGTTDNAQFNKQPLYGLKCSSNEAKFLAKMGEEKHTFQTVAFSTEEYPADEAVKYAKKNADKFTKYDLSIITADGESEAAAILKQINANEITFEDAASEKSQKYYSDSEGKISGKFGYQIDSIIDNEDKVPEVKNLAAGDVSQVIQTKRGYSIFKANGASVAADFDNKEIQDAALSYIKSNEKGIIEEYFIGIAENFAAVAATADFNTACEKFSKTMIELSAFPLNYGNSGLYEKTPDDAPYLANNAAALRTVFSLKMDEISAPVVLGSNVVVFKCAGIQYDDVEDKAASIANVLEDVDNKSAQYTLMANDKVEDNFFATYLRLLQENTNK